MLHLFEPEEARERLLCNINNNNNNNKKIITIKKRKRETERDIGKFDSHLSFFLSHAPLHIVFTRSCAAPRIK